MEELEKIYMDLDDTVKDTERYIRRVLASNGVDVNKVKGTIYNMFFTGFSLEGILARDCVKNWSVVPFKEGAMDCLRLLMSEYKVIFVSAYTFESEAKDKLEFAKSVGCDIILCDNKTHPFKNHIDMSDGIFIDDRQDVVLLSNSPKKFEMFNPYTIDFSAERDDRTTIADWHMIIDDLMYGGLDERIRLNENFRGVFYKGIQERSTAVG